MLKTKKIVPKWGPGRGLKVILRSWRHLGSPRSIFKRFLADFGSILEPVWHQLCDILAPFLLHLFLGAFPGSFFDDFGSFRLPNWSILEAKMVPKSNHKHCRNGDAIQHRKSKKNFEKQKTSNMKTIENTARAWWICMFTSCNILRRCFKNVPQ